MEFANHHTTSLASVFDVWATYDMNWRGPHYPSYEVQTRKVGTAFSLEVAERIVRETVGLAEGAPVPGRLHSLRVVQIPVGRHAPEWAPLSEYLYDRDGKLMDRRTVPWDCDSVFPGRKAEDVRFRPGDICEVLDTVRGRAYLAFVVDVPPSVEQASKINDGGFIHLEAGDDIYTIKTDASDISRDYVDSLRVFRPMHRIAPRTERRLRQAWNDCQTFPMRMKIADTAAAARLTDAAEGFGWKAVAALPSYEGDPFYLLLEGVPGFPDGVDLRIPQRKAWDHMDRVLATFRRLAGKPADGRGYRLKGPAEDGSYRL